MADQYLLEVKAGPSYDPTTHRTVLVNRPTPTHISSPICDIDLNVRVQHYRGLPRDSPSTSPYFSKAPHLYDQYSIAFSLVPKRSILGSQLLLGNDFEHPIRDRLPPGFGTALKIVKWGIDPGLDGDLYADKPHLYGNALSSLNIIRVGEKTKALPNSEGEDEAIEEGGDCDGLEWRRQNGVPESADARKKYFLTPENLKHWTWEEGRLYRADFFNPYLDFNNFALKLPGFSLSILSYLAGEDYLRYVLKLKETEEVLLVVVFALVKKTELSQEEVDQEGDTVNGQEGEEVLQEKSNEGEKDFEPKPDDLD